METMTDQGAAETARTTEATTEATAETAAETATEAATEATTEATTETAMTEAATAAELETKEPDYKTENATLRERVTGLMARTAAIVAGVKPERAEYAVTLADLSDVDPTADDASTKIEAAIQKVLIDLPEIKVTAAIGTGGTGNHARTTAQVDPFVRGLKG